MKQVTTIEALRDLSRFLRDMYCWCDQNGSYTTGSISVGRGTVKDVRRCVDAIISNMQNDVPIYVMDGCDGVYEQLVQCVEKNVRELRKKAHE